MISLRCLFGRTERATPSDATSPGHRLLVRAGFVQRWSSGVHSLMPLGQLVQERITAIVVEELERVGSQQVTMPALVPRSMFETSGRWDEYGDALFRLRDRRGADHLLAPTHEELFTVLVKDNVPSYKHLPLSLFQVQTKFRDELRPRAGLIRGREFVMADAYSFDLDDHGLARSYEAHRAAFVRMFRRMGLDCLVVHAVSGSMGGSESEEFLAPSEAGEDVFARCSTCGFAANTEALPPAAEPGPVDVATPTTGDCPRCGDDLERGRAIEVGHIFQLGTKYSEAFDLRLQDSEARLRPVTMGSYGVGVSRALGVIAEQRCDERGLMWPASIAPAAVHVLTAGHDDADQQRTARTIVEQLERVGVTCLLDDRAEGSFGRRLADAELIGAPVILVVGRGLASGVIEFRNRHTGSVDEVAVDCVVARVAEVIDAPS